MRQLRLALMLVMLGFIAGCGVPVQPNLVQQDRLRLASDLAARNDLAGAARVYRELADDGVAKASYEFGRLLLEGKGVSQDATAGAARMLAAAEGGYPPAMRRLGQLLVDGEGIGEDLPAARAWFERAIEAGEKNARFDLALLLLEGGAGVAPDPQAGIELMREAARSGYLPAQLELAVIYDEGRSVRPNPAEARRWYAIAAAPLRRLAEAGDAKQQHRLGRLYLEGRGVPQDVELGLAWIERAASAGRVAALSDLARLYIEGAPGVPQDVARGIGYLRAAIDRGHATSAYELGKLYFKGDVIARDPEAALEMFTLAMNQGERRAYLYLGELHMEPDVPFRDPEEAAAWFARAAGAGDGKAYFRLAELHQSGVITEADKALALALFELAAEHGYGRGAAYAERLAAELPPAEIERSRALKPNWAGKF